MSGRLIAAVGRLPATRSAAVRAVRQYHQLPSGGILRADAAVRATRRRMWFPVNNFHNAVIVRNASFARFLPRLVVKFIRIPAMAGGVMIGGLAWIQYQATRMLTVWRIILETCADLDFRGRKLRLGCYKYYERLRHEYCNKPVWWCERHR